MIRRAGVATAHVAFALAVLAACRAVLDIEELGTRAADASGEAGGSEPTVDASTASPDTGAGSDAASEGSCTAGVPAVSASLIPCPTTRECEARYEMCCLSPDGDAGLCLQNGYACGPALDGSRMMQCLRNAHCAPSYRCCLTARRMDDLACPPVAELVTSACLERASCGEEIELCAAADSCSKPGARCVPLMLSGPMPLLIGMCR